MKLSDFKKVFNKKECKDTTQNWKNLVVCPRRDTMNEWEQNNPILRLNEIAVAYCDNETKYKLGDGVRTFVFLPFASLEDVFNNGWIYSDEYKLIVSFKNVNGMEG